MYSFEVSHNIAKAVVFHFLNRKKKVKRNKNSKNVIQKLKTNSDFIDYDGMGNYGRFPCIKK